MDVSEDESAEVGRDRLRVVNGANTMAPTNGRRIRSQKRCPYLQLSVFRELCGSEVGRKRFNNQYEGPTLDKDITGIRDATMRTSPSTQWAFFCL